MRLRCDQLVRGAEIRHAALKILRHEGMKVTAAPRARAGAASVGRRRRPYHQARRQYTHSLISLAETQSSPIARSPRIVLIGMPVVATVRGGGRCESTALAAVASSGGATRGLPAGLWTGLCRADPIEIDQRARQPGQPRSECCLERPP